MLFADSKAGRSILFSLFAVLTSGGTLFFPLPLLFFLFRWQEELCFLCHHFLCRFDSGGKSIPLLSVAFFLLFRRQEVCSSCCPFFDGRRNSIPLPSFFAFPTAEGSLFPLPFPFFSSFDSKRKSVPLPSFLCVFDHRGSSIPLVVSSFLPLSTAGGTLCPVPSLSWHFRLQGEVYSPCCCLFFCFGFDGRRNSIPLLSTLCVFDYRREHYSPAVRSLHFDRRGKSIPPAISFFFRFRRQKELHSLCHRSLCHFDSRRKSIPPAVNFFCSFDGRRKYPPAIPFFLVSTAGGFQFFCHPFFAFSITGRRLFPCRFLFFSDFDGRRNSVLNRKGKSIPPTGAFFAVSTAGGTDFLLTSLRFFLLRGRRNCVPLVGVSMWLIRNIKYS